MADEKVEYIYVRSGRSDNRVAISEVDPAHPGGSILVANNGPHKAAKTAFVMQRLREGELRESKSAADKKAAEHRAKLRIESNPRPENIVDVSDQDEQGVPEGYEPTDEELAAAGMTREELEADREKQDKKDK